MMHEVLVLNHWHLKNLTCVLLQANLHALTEMKPALTHLGDKGVLLLLR